MHKKILITLSKSSINKAIKELQEYEERVKRKAKELAERLAFLGGTVASIKFSQTFYVGDNDVKVDVIEKDNKYIINANGQAVCFIEFGTGVGAHHPLGDEYGFYPGSYSEKNKKKFSEKGYWYYDKQKIFGSTPGNCMYLTSKELRDRIKDIALEVFGND